MTTKKLPNPMNGLYKSIRTLGFTKPQVRNILPDWWDDQIADTPAGLQEATYIIAKRLSINYASLRDGVPEFNLQKHCFKRTTNLQERDLSNAVSYAVLSGRLTLDAFSNPLRSDISSLNALAIRKILIERHSPWIDFSTLLNFVWEIGIPVIFIEKLPTPKMQGLALQVDDRPVIILTSAKNIGHLVFDLAHELGHIVLGHVDNENWMMDSKINSSDDGLEDKEKEANEFALALLTGKETTSINSTNPLSPQNLAKAAISTGRELRIDPFHIALNYAHTTKRFNVSALATSEIAKRLGAKETDQETCKAAYLRNIDFDLLEDDEQAVRHLVGAK